MLTKFASSFFILYIIFNLSFLQKTILNFCLLIDYKYRYLFINILYLVFILRYLI